MAGGLTATEGCARVKRQAIRPRKIPRSQAGGVLAMESLAGWVRRETKSMGDREPVNRFAAPGTLPAAGKPTVGSSEKSSSWMKRTIHISGKLEPFFGTLDENVRLLEESLRVRTHLHDSKLTIEGEQHAVTQAAKIVEEYNHATHSGKELTGEEVKSLICVALDAPAESPRGLFEPSKLRAFGKKSVAPRNAAQRHYMEEIEKHDMMFGIGPAGTGKTYIAVAMAVSALLTKQVSRIILARPAVEAGERLGFLPGTLQEKVDPYMRPLYDALYDMLDPDKLESFLEKGIIEIAPLAFMRGRTLNESFVILDEAQNTTSEQMKMFLTRLGFNSKAVVTGDVTQIDLPIGKKSGLIEALEICGKIEGIGVVHFTDKDVVRHNLVQRIIRAYEEYEVDHPQRGNGKSEHRHPDHGPSTHDKQ
jgi:phosphate starvation-inducible PhoH-like protein